MNTITSKLHGRLKLHASTMQEYSLQKKEMARFIEKILVPHAKKYGCNFSFDRDVSVMNGIVYAQMILEAEGGMPRKAMHAIAVYLYEILSGKLYVRGERGIYKSSYYSPGGRSYLNPKPDVIRGCFRIKFDI
jgi:hypothetical protein